MNVWISLIWSLLLGLGVQGAAAAQFEEIGFQADGIGEFVDCMRAARGATGSNVDVTTRVVTAPNGRYGVMYVFFGGGEPETYCFLVEENGLRARLFWIPVRRAEFHWSPDSRFLAVLDYWDTKSGNVDVFSLARIDGQLTATLMVELPGPYATRYVLKGWNLKEGSIDLQREERFEPGFQSDRIKLSIPKTPYAGRTQQYSINGEADDASGFTHETLPRIQSCLPREPNSVPPTKPADTQDTVATPDCAARCK